MEYCKIGLLESFVESEGGRKPVGVQSTYKQPFLSAKDFIFGKMRLARNVYIQDKKDLSKVRKEFLGFTKYIRENINSFSCCPTIRIYGDASIDDEQLKTVKNTGFIYQLHLYNRKTGDRLFKIGSSLNPVMRIANHKFKNYKGYSLLVIRVAFCREYLTCEAHIKNHFNSKEVVNITNLSDESVSDVNKKINTVINKHVLDDLDTTTINHVINVDNIRKYFSK